MQQFSNPRQHIAHLSIPNGAIVADFGAGSGAYAIAAAHKAGRVYAIEVQRELLPRIQKEAQAAHVGNIEFIWGDVERREGSKLRTDSVDVVLVCNILFITEDKKGLVREVKRVLKNAGKVLVIDWTDSHGGVGPDDSMVVTQEFAEKLFRQAGFEKLRDIEAGSHHWGMILQKQTNKPEA